MLKSENKHQEEHVGLYELPTIISQCLYGVTHLLYSLVTSESVKKICCEVIVGGKKDLQAFKKILLVKESFTLSRETAILNF